MRKGDSRNQGQHSRQPLYLRNNHAGSPHQDSPRPNSLVHGSVALGSEGNGSFFSNHGSQPSSF
jgi:hypothetical protein